MNTPTSKISGYHAHIYYVKETRSAAEELRSQLDTLFPVKLGRMHDTNVGPHTAPMYQVVFSSADFCELVPWLMLNRRGLDILIHPETGDDLEDHSTHALWLGNKLDLDWSKL